MIRIPTTKPQTGGTPREITSPHLAIISFKSLGLPPTATGIHAVGKGYVLYESQSPAALTYLPDGGNRVYDLVQRAAKSAHLTLKETNALVLRRGPYVVAAGLDHRSRHQPAGIRPSAIRDRRPDQSF